MAITLVSTPEPIVSPALNCKWLATESPNNFRLFHDDFLVTDSNESTGSPAGNLVVTITAFTGNESDNIAIHDNATNALFTGTVLSIDGTDVLTDIPWQDGMEINYLNDNTLHGGYHFEGRLTVNGVLQSYTIISSPDSFGIADLDVSGILRIMTSIGKKGDYSSRLMAETTKGGMFTLEYRECWYGSDEAYTAEGHAWHYVECVRSEEQGSNLYEFMPDDNGYVPFLNSFDRPIYFYGFPFDLTFLCAIELSDNTSQLLVEVNQYDSDNELIGTVTETHDAVEISNLRGSPCSLTIN